MQEERREARGAWPGRRVSRREVCVCAMPLFAPDYGAASAHITELQREREDFVAASVAQAASISSLEKQLALCREDLLTANEQLEVQGLISESRARQLEEERATAEAMQTKLARMRSAIRLLWGLMQEQQMRVNEQENSIRAGSELLESLSELLGEPKPATPRASDASDGSGGRRT